MGTISSGIRAAQGIKMVLWVTIENPASGLVVALSSAYNGAQLHLEREVFGKADQLWDYEEAVNNCIFRNKAGFVADLKASVGPEVICWSHHGGANQRFRHEGGKFITSQINNNVWDVEQGNMSPGGKIIVWGKHGGVNQQFIFRGKDSCY